MKSLKEIVGAEPVYHEEDNSYTPSKASLAVSTKKTTDYDHKEYPNAYQGEDKKVLVMCVDEQYLVCKNEKRMRTGNHPVELAVVLLHLEKAGFQLEFATIQGESVKIEEFAMPTEDEAVMDFFERNKEVLENPTQLSEVVEELKKANQYEAVYFPGGHGAVLGLPESRETKAVLQSFIKEDKPIITICHGPSSLLSLTIDEKPEDFPFKDYKMALFPDGGDKLMLTAGYLPGEMPFGFSTLLEELGVHITSKVPVGVTQVDRKLISGDSPFAANKLGNIAAEFLLNELDM